MKILALNLKSLRNEEHTKFHNDVHGLITHYTPALLGIEAKMIIKDGQVKVNGEVELRRGKKLHDGDQVEFEGNFYCINAHQ